MSVVIMMQSNVFAIGILCISLISFSKGHDGSSSIRYDAESFEENISKAPHFVMFFAPWCGHCKRLAPTWEELAEKYNKELESNKVIIAKVDCTTDTALCSSQDVTGYPTLKFFKPGDTEPVRYRGNRDLDSLQKFITEQMEGANSVDEESKIEIPTAGNGLIELTDETFHKFVEYGYHFVKFYAPWCGHCQKLAPVWQSLADSLKHDGSVGIAQVDCTAYKGICQEFEVKGYPTLVWIQDGKKIDKYQGGRTHEALKAYVLKMKGEAQDHESVQSDDGKVPTADMSVVVLLTTDNFDNAIASGVTFVKFYAPWCGHCKRLAPTWEELGKKFVRDSNIKIAKVDCTAEINKQLCNENEVEGYPTLQIYKNGHRVEEYKGGRELSELHAFVMSHAVKDEL